MVYNITAIGNNTGVVNFVQLVNNELMFGSLGLLLMIIIGSICFMAFLAATNDAAKSISATAFLMVGFGILLRLIDLIPNLVLFITVIVFAGTLAFIKN